MTLKTFRCAQESAAPRRVANSVADSPAFLSELASKEHNHAPVDKSGASAGEGDVPRGGADASAAADEELARDFWRSVEQRPPLYGADLQLSLFDKELPTGCVPSARLTVRSSGLTTGSVRERRRWNLRSLGCLLQTSNLPAIPGVTTCVATRAVPRCA